MRTNSYAISHPGMIRTNNEDGYLEMPDYGLWVVADGMGGHKAGGIASQLLIDSIERAVIRVTQEEITAQFLVSLLQRINLEILDYSNNFLSGDIIGTTVVILLLKNNEYVWLWAGDSRGYHFDGCTLVLQTIDHTPVTEPDLSIFNDYESCANIITRAVGAQQQLDIETFSGRCSGSNLFILCSDGLNKEMSDIEIQQHIDDGDITGSGKALLHSALVMGARDNVTCILVDVLA